MSWRTTWTLLGAGIALGAVNTCSNYGLTPMAPYVSKIVGNDWGWLTASFLAAWAGASWRSAATRSLTLLIPAVLTYYVLDYVLIQRIMGFTPSPPGSYVFESLMWACASGVVSVVLGGLARLIRRPGYLGIPAAAALPAFIAYTAHDANGQRWVDPILADVTAVLWPVAAGIAVFAAIARALFPPMPDAPEPPSEVARPHESRDVPASELEGSSRGGGTSQRMTVGPRLYGRREPPTHTRSPPAQ